MTRLSLGVSTRANRKAPEDDDRTDDQGDEPVPNRRAIKGASEEDRTSAG